MMKAAFLLTTIIVAALLCGHAAYGQQQRPDTAQRASKSRNSGTYGRGIRLVSVGYGYPARLAPAGHSGTGAWPQVGPLVGRFEFAINDVAGVGGMVQMGVQTLRYGPHRDLAVGVALGSAGYYHFNKFIAVPRLDVYAFGGIGVVYRHLNYDNDATTAPGLATVRIIPLVGAGVRYYLGQRMGLYAEGGLLGLCYGHAGLTLRMWE